MTDISRDKNGNNMNINHVKKMVCLMSVAVLLCTATPCNAENLQSVEDNEDSIALQKMRCELLLQNTNEYVEDVIPAVAGKKSNDWSLLFGTVEAEGSTDNIFAEVRLPINKSYIKYEINFMADSTVKEICFTTKGDTPVSPCISNNITDTADTDKLSNKQWNRIVLLIHNTNIIGGTGNDVPCEVDLFLNGNKICEQEKYSFRKNGETEMLLRFVVYANQNTSGNYPMMKSYLDDLDISTYSEKPEIIGLPFVVKAENEKCFDINKDVLTLYKYMKVNELEVSEGAKLRVFETDSFETVVTDEAYLSSNNIVVLEDVDNRMSYYRINDEVKNDAMIDVKDNTYTASGKLDGAIMIVAGYGKGGTLQKVVVSEEGGDISTDITGEFENVKVFIWKSLDTLVPLSNPIIHNNATTTDINTNE